MSVDGKRLSIVFAALLVLVVGVFGHASAIQFKKNLLTEVLPSLLAGLFAIAAITERATAVLSDIWLGRERAEAEDDARLVNRKVEAETQKVVGVQAMAANAAKVGNNQFFTAGATALNVMAAPAAVVAMQADLQAADEKLRDVKSREQQLRLSFAFLVAVAVSAVGVRVLNTLLDAELTSQHVFAFAGVDILLTAGVLTGGTAAINTISGLLGTYVETTRKRALER